MRDLEAFAANAWPGLRWALVDGWILRLADGYSRRANSVLPLDPGHSPLDERIARCEALYAGAGQRPVFKLYPDAQPAGLDAELERRGYARDGEGRVLVLDPVLRDPVRPDPVAAPAGLRWSVADRPDGPWFELYTASGGLDARSAAAARAILGCIVPAHRFVLLEGADGPAGCALVVAEHGLAGVFDVAVRPDLRGRGLGRALMARVQAEAAACGARRCCLQVLDSNRVARNLYRSLGYRTAYPYWFRTPARHG